jgi:DNA-directed RNA polymerase subunit RPC12/RpoP
MLQQFVFSLGIIIPGCIILLALRDDRVYRCCNCGHEYSPSDKDMVKSKGSSVNRKLRCPSCGQECVHERVYKR